jgi:hypothetical protein
LVDPYVEVGVVVFAKVQVLLQVAFGGRDETGVRGGDAQQRQGNLYP